MINSLKDNTGFNFTTYQVTLKVTKTVVFDYYPGFILRNAIVGGMSELFCVNYTKNKGKAGGCESCNIINTCIYHKLNLPVSDKKENIPQAFVIDANTIPIGAKFRAGSSIQFRLTLFGLANSYLLQWIKTFEYSGNVTGIGTGSGRFELTGFGAAPDNEKQISSAGLIKLHFPYLHFSNHKPKESLISFSKLIAGITERVNNLNSLYNPFSGETIKTAQPAGVNVESENFSTVVLAYPGGSHNKYVCYNGYAVYKGNLQPYLHLIYPGSITGIGQFAAYGIGTYRINYDNFQ